MSQQSFEEWQKTLIKPSWAPKGEFITTVWSTLYPIIIPTYAYMFWEYSEGRLPGLTALCFALNLFLNLIFYPFLLRYLRNLKLCLLDTMLLWITLAAALILSVNDHPGVVILNIPYWIWATVANRFQYEITTKNP